MSKAIQNATNNKSVTNSNQKNLQNYIKAMEKQIAKAEKKKEKRGGKKSFMQRMMDASEEAQKELEKQEAMRKNGSVNLKNYVPSDKSQQVADKNSAKKYKEGSIGAKANIMMNYNNREEK